MKTLSVVLLLLLQDAAPQAIVSVVQTTGENETGRRRVPGPRA